MVEQITRKELAEFIQHIRRTLGWNYQTMAERTGINVRTLADYGAGKALPRNLADVVGRIRKAAAEEQRRRRREKTA